MGRFMGRWNQFTIVPTIPPTTPGRPMPYSMTAFARCDRETPWGSLAWELRSVNHRYLELALRLPEELRGLEPAVRDTLSKRLARGKVDCNLRFQPREATGGELKVDEALLGRLLALGRRAEELAAGYHAGVGPWRVGDLLRWPGVLQAAEPDLGALGEAALGLFHEAVEELVATRRREGERLCELLRQRLDAMAAVAAQLRALLPELAESQRARLHERLEELRAQLDAARLEQELVMALQKADVGEELDRLEVHIGEARRVLDQGGPVGRRLDFLMQELNREANTLGAKSADLRQTNASVDLKVLIEQLREQVQNLE